MAFAQTVRGARGASFGSPVDDDGIALSQKLARSFEANPISGASNEHMRHALNSTI